MSTETKLVSPGSKHFSLSGIQWTTAILLILASSFLHRSVYANDFQGCNDCHVAELYEDSIRSFLHFPFAQAQCGECHSAQALTPLPTQNPDNSGNRQKIDWLGDTAILDTNHAFLLPGVKVGETLVAELHTANGNVFSHNIDVPLLAELSEVEDSGKPPVLSDVLVLQVQRSVFLSVTIGWQTDTLTSALVRYGDPDLVLKSEPSKRFGREHQVVLYNLKADRTYRYTAIATDLFGRSQSSAPLTFSTSNPFTAPQQDDSGNLPVNVAEIDITSSFQRLGPDYLIELTLDQAASVFIGSTGAPLNQEPSSGDGTNGYEAEESHAGLSSEIVISMDACYSCHQGQSIATHPVNVLPKPGMTIPPEYPTLPDGRITCNSCHFLHSSDYEFLSRKEGKRDLCVGCHKDMM